MPISLSSLPEEVYNCSMESGQQFRPEQISRTGERNAWMLAIAAWALSWVMVRAFDAPVLLLSAFAGFLTLAAAAISLSNWIDRKTVMILTPEGVAFRNGLRNVKMDWAQIQKVRVVSDRWGKRVHVLGTEAHFNFRMLSEIEFQEKLHEKMGFTNGEEILQAILKSSGLELAADDEQSNYYARP